MEDQLLGQGAASDVAPPELPQDVVIPATIALSDESFAEVCQRTENPRKPTLVMQRLMKRRSQKKTSPKP
jgi:uncharacterized protein (DUF1778 family)